MLLKPTLAISIVNVYFWGAFIRSAIGRTYTQNEINNAWKRMRSKNVIWTPIDDKFGCWPENVVTYTIDPAFTQKQTQHIMKDIHQIQNRTCVRWVEKNTAPVRKYVEFHHVPEDSGKCSTVDYFEKHSIKNDSAIITRIYLGDHCFPYKAVIHEMLHAMGFIHEQSRIDRDCYVLVNDKYANNVNLGIIYDEVTFEKWPYDKRSIMHYPRNPASSWWTDYVLKDKDEPFGGLIWKYRLGPTHGSSSKRSGQLSYLDVFKINYRYCGAPDFCETQPKMCRDIEEEETMTGCKQLYMDIVSGKYKPTYKTG